MLKLPIHHLPNEFRCFAFAMAIGLLGILASAMPFSADLKEGFGLKLLFSLRGAVKPPPEVILVTIDRQSATQLNLPIEIDKWPRRIHAQVIDRLHREGAAVIVFDLLFSDPQSPQDDQRLALSMRLAQNVVLAEALTRERVPMTDRYGHPNGFLNIVKRARPIPILAEAAMAQAPFPLPQIPICLTQYWTFKAGAGDMPTLPVVVFHAFARQAYREFIRLLIGIHPTYESLIPTPQGPSYPIDQMLSLTTVLRGIFRQQPDLGRRMRKALDRNIRSSSTASIKEQIISLIELYERQTSRYLNLYGPTATIPTIPYYRLVSPATGQTNLNISGKVVFIGVTQSTAWPQVRDGYYTVYSQNESLDMSGVEIAASAFANLVESRGVWLPEWPIHMGVIMLWGIMVALISFRFHPTTAALALFTLCGVYLWGITLHFSRQGIWLPVAVPLAIQMPLAYLSAIGHKYSCLSTERQNIRLAFGHYLPNPIVDKLSRNINYLHDGGQILYSVCLLTDAEKYTGLSESMNPKELTCLMNRYYQAVFEPIKAHGGLVLQVVGDSVLAIWPAPHSDAHLKAKACAAALGIDAAVQRFNAQAEDYQLPTRIGMHAGYILLGNIGALDHFEYRPVGDIVNTASRLEGLNKYLGTRLLISEEIRQHLKGFRTRCMGKFVFIGKSKPNTVYELIDSAKTIDAKEEKAHQHFDAALCAFHQQAWDTARNAFNEVQRLIGPDTPSNFYLKLCDAYRRCSPDADWDGTIYMKQK